MPSWAHSPTRPTGPNRPDPTRRVSAALLTLPTGGTDHDIDDGLGEIVDVVAFNQYLGWYDADRHTIADHRWHSYAEIERSEPNPDAGPPADA